jgi:hypothetical protein
MKMSLCWAMGDKGFKRLHNAEALKIHMALRSDDLEKKQRAGRIL